MKPLPDSAKMVFKGKIFEVWQWEQKMYDGSTEIFERLKRPDTAVVIPVVGDQILIADEEQPDTGPFTTIPSGRIEAGEEPLEGAKRELLEETGYASNSWEEFFVVRPVSKIEWNVYVYIAHDCTHVQDVALDAGEKIVPRLVSFDEFIALSDNANFRCPEVIDVVLRARLDPQKMQELKTRILRQ